MQRKRVGRVPSKKLDALDASVIESPRFPGHSSQVFSGHSSRTSRIEETPPMLKKLALALSVVALAFGCSKPAANTANTTNTGNSNARVADGKIDVKDRVLIPSGVSK